MKLTLELADTFNDDITIKWQARRGLTRGMERGLRLKWLDSDNHDFSVIECINFHNPMFVTGHHEPLSVWVFRIRLMEHSEHGDQEGGA